MRTNDIGYHHIIPQRTVFVLPHQTQNREADHVLIIYPQNKRWQLDKLTSNRDYDLTLVDVIFLPEGGEVVKIVALNSDEFIRAYSWDIEGPIEYKLTNDVPQRIEQN